MKISKIRVIALIISCILLMSTLMACVAGKTDDPTPKVDTTTEDKSTVVSDSGVPNMTAPGVLPIVDRPVTITIGIPENPQITDYKDNHFTKWIEEQTGINIEFDFLPNATADARRKLELLVASNSKLADILYISTTTAIRENYGLGGVVIALDDYFDKYSHFYKKEAMEVFSEDEIKYIFNLGRSSDGKLYGFPTMSDSPTDRYPRSWCINKKWLDYLGLDKPVTTDDLYSVLKAFKEKDPNQNGKPDEIPLVGSASGWNQQVDMVILNAFLYVPKDHYFIVDNGKIDVCCTKEEYKEGIRYLNKLCREDLCSPVSFTQGAEQLKAMTDLSPEQDTYVGIWCGSATHNFSTKNKKVLDFEALSPPTGPNGISWSQYAPVGHGFNGLITRDCKTPEIAFRLMDFLMSEEATITGRWGIKGEDWNYIEKGSKESAYSKYGLGHETFFELTNKRALWGQPNNVIWNNLTPLFVNRKMITGKPSVESDDELIQYRNTIAFQGFSMRYGKIPKEIVTNLAYTIQEIDELDEIASTIDSYIGETRIRFIVGDLDIDKDWDKYIKDLEKMGLKRYIEITQNCYTRLTK